MATKATRRTNVTPVAATKQASSARTQQAASIPAGYQNTPAGIKPIPGGSADPAKTGNQNTMRDEGRQNPTIYAGGKGNPIVSNAPQQSAGVQTFSNGFGSQQGGPGVQTASASPYTLPGSAATGTETFGSGYQPKLDALNNAQGTLKEGYDLQFDQINKNYTDIFGLQDEQMNQATSDLQYDPKTGTFSGLAKDEEAKIKAPFQEEIGFQAIQADKELSQTQFESTLANLKFTKEYKDTAKLLDNQKMLRETFAGLSGAFGSSRTFEYMQEKEIEGQDTLNSIVSEAAAYGKYYSDKLSGINNTYTLNVASLRRQMAEKIDTRYTDLISQVDKIRNEKKSSIAQKQLDIRGAVLDYNKGNADLAIKAGDIMSEYSKALREAAAAAQKEDVELRDGIGQGIVDTYDKLIPGFVPSTGKIQEFTNAIYEGILKYQETGGQEGFPNLQSGLGAVMNAIRSNDSVFQQYNPELIAQKLAAQKAAKSSGPSTSGKGPKLNANQILVLKAAGYTPEEIGTYALDVPQELAGLVDSPPKQSWWDMVPGATQSNPYAADNYYAEDGE